MTTVIDRADGRPPRKPRSDGERSRAAILREAAQLATVEGIDGLSIGRLADAVGMSKSGLYRHFGSKLGLQLATIDAAGVLFSEHVTEPAASGPTALDRLGRLTENYLRYVEDRIFPGGCFFASLVTEMGAREGPVRDRASEFMDEWMSTLETAITDAQSEGSIDRSIDATRLAFELESYLFLANAQFVLSGQPKPIEEARRALERRLAEVTSLP